MEEEKEKRKQPTYNELLNYVDSLSMQNRQLIDRLNQITDITNKLPFLFKVIENNSMFSADVIDKCVNEISDILMLSEESQNTSSNETEA